MQGCCLSLLFGAGTNFGRFVFSPSARFAAFPPSPPPFSLAFTKGSSLALGFGGSRWAFLAVRFGSVRGARRPAQDQGGIGLQELAERFLHLRALRPKEFQARS